jgi:hypothetical protein
MATYEETAAAVTVGPVGGMTALLGDLMSSEFVHHAIQRAVVAVTASGVPTSPSGSSDAPGGTQQALDIRITSQVLPAPDVTDDITFHTVCTTHTLHVLGHHLGTWTTCEDVVTSPDPLPSGDTPTGGAAPSSSGGGQEEVARVRVDLTAAPPATTDGSPAPAWVAPLTAEIVSADLVTDALVAAVLDAVVTHRMADTTDTTDAPAPMVLTSHAVTSSGSTDSGGSLHCQEHFYTIGGVQLYHWTVCTETTDIGGTPSPPPPVHLEVEHPKHHH